MNSRMALRPRTLLLIPAMLALILALACGASATATFQPTNTPVAPTATLPPPTPTATAEPAVVAPDGGEPGLAVFDIVNPIIDPDE